MNKYFGLEKYAARPDLLSRLGQETKKEPREQNIFESSYSAGEKQTPNQLDTAYSEWQAAPNAKSMQKVIKAANPTINSALRSYGSGNSAILRGKAKKIAIKAIKTYDSTGKANLKSWLNLQLQGLRRHAGSTSPLTLPERVKMDAFALVRAKDEFVAVNDREPNYSELAEATGLSAKRIQYVQNLSNPTISEGELNKDIDDDSFSSYLPGVEDNSWENIWTEYVYNDLSEIDKKIFDMRMGRGVYKNKQMTVGDMAASLGISAAAVSQRSKRISSKLAEVYE